MRAAEELAPISGMVEACRCLGISRASVYRARKPVGAAQRRPKPDRALSERERQGVLDELHSERFVDQAPAQVYATLLDEGLYLCSMRTIRRSS